MSLLDPAEKKKKKERREKDDMEGESRRTSFRDSLQLNQSGCNVKPPLRARFHKHLKPALPSSSALPSPLAVLFLLSPSCQHRCLYGEPEASDLLEIKVLKEKLLNCDPDGFPDVSHRVAA